MSRVTIIGASRLYRAAVALATLAASPLPERGHLQWWRRSYRKPECTRKYATRSRWDPHQGERECLRRRLGGFHRRHWDA